MVKKNSDRKKISPEMITALSAVLIGVCAIGISLYETSLIRQHQKSSVWPYVDAGYSYNQEGFRFVLMNTGIGPAKVEYAIVKVDGEPVQNWREFFEVLDLEVSNYLTSQVAKRVMPAESTVEALVLTPDQPIDELYRMQHRVWVEWCYCSVYDDCWMKRMMEEAAPVRACVADEEKLFLN